MVCGSCELPAAGRRNNPWFPSYFSSGILIPHLGFDSVGIEKENQENLWRHFLLCEHQSTSQVFLMPRCVIPELCKKSKWRDGGDEGCGERTKKGSAGPVSSVCREEG